MSKLGKIVLENNCGNPKVIIAEGGRYPNGIELVQNCEGENFVSISDDAIVKTNYRGKKLDNCKANLNNTAIYNLKIREIGCLTEEGYYKLLRQYVSYQTYLGGTNSSYKMVRTEVQEQLIKKMK